MPKPPTTSPYFTDCSRALMRRYGISCADAGLDAAYVEQFNAPGVERTPDEFAEWYGEKMALAPNGGRGWDA